MNTKESILLEALKLFAQDGYEGVSVRAIAKQLGITQAALYKHYSSKQNIFDSIVNHMNDDYKNRSSKFGIPLGTSADEIKMYEKISLETIEYISIEQFQYWIQDEYASYFRRMLILEQYRNIKMSNLYQHYLGSGAISYMETVFLEMIRAGFFRKGNAKLLALDFYSPIYMLMTLYDGTDDKESIIKMVREHIKQFTRNYSVKQY